MKIDLKKRDRVCFFGDSITADGLWIKEISEYFKNSFSQLEIGFYNCGIAGTKAFGANVKDRIYTDLLKFFPKYVVVMFGMNDIWVDLYAENCKVPKNVELREKKLESYPKNLEYIIEMCLKYGAEPIICSPTIYDEYCDKEKENCFADSAMKKASEYAQKVAVKHGLLYIDMRKALLDNISKNPINDDRVHPNEFGHHLMAQSFLKGIGAIDEINPDKMPKYSEINEKRFLTEQKLRNIELIESCIMGWQFEPDMTVEERKKKIAKRIAENPKDEWFKSVSKPYLENVDFKAPLLGELVKLTLKMYE